MPQRASRSLRLIALGGRVNTCMALSAAAGALAAFGLAPLNETGHVRQCGGLLQQQIDSIAEQLRNLVAECSEDEQGWDENSFAAALLLVGTASDIDAMSDAMLSVDHLKKRLTRAPLQRSVSAFAKAAAAQVRLNSMMGA